MTDVLLTPNVYLWTRAYMLSELESRGHTFDWYRATPEARSERFGTIQPLNQRMEHVFTSSVLTQIEVHDTDEERGETVADLVSSLWDVMPNSLQVQNVEHAGGPTLQVDPDAPMTFTWLITKWVTVMKTPK